METNMFRTKFLAATALAGILATSAFAAVERVGKIDVTIDLAALQNEQAATFWANLEADLENAIAARLTDRLVSEEEQLAAQTEANEADDESSEGVMIVGSQILVDVREVELANAFQRELNLGDAVLVGQVNIKDDADNTNVDAYELSVSLESAQVIVPEGATLVLSTDTTQAYNKLVEAFAEGVVTRLK
jgi:hypothetical protein